MKKLKIFETAVSYNMITASGFYGKIYGCYGNILNGSVQDSDYIGDNRTQGHSRSISDASNGKVLI